MQVSSQRSEAEAQAAFRSLQAKYPGQLGGKQPLIHQVDLGAKGIYYRAMVGPFATGSEASELCSSLKAAGGQCIIQTELTRRKLDPCGGRGLIRADGGTRIHHRIGGTRRFPPMSARFSARPSPGA